MRNSEKILILKKMFMKIIEYENEIELYKKEIGVRESFRMNQSIVFCNEINEKIKEYEDKLFDKEDKLLMLYIDIIDFCEKWREK